MRFTATLIVSAACCLASAQTAIFVESVNNVGTAPGAYGFEFRPKWDIWVTKIGVFDPGGGGLPRSVRVGIVDGLSNTILVSEEVPGGTGVQFIGGFRFVDVTPTRLIADGTFQTIAIFEQGGPAVPWTTSSDATIGVSFALEDGSVRAIFNEAATSFGDPMAYHPDHYAFAGPNFWYSTRAIPGPAAVLPMAFSLLAMRLRTRRAAKGGAA
jgi:hypothetical protein